MFFEIRDPGSGIRDPGSGIRDGKNPDPGSGIRDKHPGSATLLLTHRKIWERCESDTIPAMLTENYTFPVMLTENCTFLHLMKQSPGSSKSVPVVCTYICTCRPRFEKYLLNTPQNICYSILTTS